MVSTNNADARTATATAAAAWVGAGESDGNPESDAERAFLAAFPGFAGTRWVDELRATAYARLDRQRQVYLDYTGGSLYADTQVAEHLDLLARHVLGNTHSASGPSRSTADLVEEARQAILDHFGAPPEEYLVVFTANATGALKLVGEAYPFDPAGALLLSSDNHNSVNGIREYARERGARVRYLPLVPGALTLDEDSLQAALREPGGGGPRLLAYPAQSNFSGVQYPLRWVAEAQARGWDVLVDAAAFAPTNRLDLELVHPDFVAVSFYKMFGYPTGVGCLLARKAALARLRRPWYAGGTITFSSVAGFGHYLTPGALGFEDGTLNYLSVPAVTIGLRHLARVGVDVIHDRVTALTGWLLEQLGQLRHHDGAPRVRVYGPTTNHGRGATVSFNLLDPRGRLVDGYAVEARANQHGIALRTGCHCNPGAREVALGFGEDDMRACFERKDHQSFSEFVAGIAGKTTGTIRASLGIASNFHDVYALVRFLDECPL